MKNPHHIAIIDLGAGNLRSVDKAVARAAQDHGLDVEICVTTDPAQVAKADRIILPGVGAFGACMAGLNGLPGVRAALERSVVEDRTPLLGICVGMQMLATRGMEFGETPGLGWIAGTVEKFDPEARHVRVPHMGWNNVAKTQNHDLFEMPNNLDNTDFYFLHSFHFEPEMTHHTIAVCDYGGPVVSMIAHRNIAGVQFHPEKSQGAGLAFLGNFLQWTP